MALDIRRVGEVQAEGLDVFVGVVLVLAGLVGAPVGVEVHEDDARTDQHARTEGYDNPQHQCARVVAIAARGAHDGGLYRGNVGRLGGGRSCA